MENQKHYVPGQNDDNPGPPNLPALRSFCHLPAELHPAPGGTGNPPPPLSVATTTRGTEKQKTGWQLAGLTCQ